MKIRFLFLVFIIFGAVILAAAQAKTVTNADLAKYKQERIKGETDLRENYAKLGFASPEELERRREQSRIETERLSAKLRDERLERERIELQALSNLAAANAYARANQQPFEPVLTDPGYFWSYQWSNGRRYRYRVPRQYGQYQQPGYFAGGQFWPTGARTFPQPLFMTPRRR